MENSKSLAGTTAQQSTNADVITSSSHNAKPNVSGSFYNYPTLIEPIYNGNGGTVVKDYRVVGQDGSFPNPLFYGTYNECVKWRSENCR